MEVKALSDLLGNKAYIMGDRVSSYDASVYAWIACVSQGGWEHDLSAMMREYKNLIDYAERMKEEFYQDMETTMRNHATTSTDDMPARSSSSVSSSSTISSTDDEGSSSYLAGQVPTKHIFSIVVYSFLFCYLEYKSQLMNSQVPSPMTFGMRVLMTAVIFILSMFVSIAISEALTKPLNGYFEWTKNKKTRVYSLKATIRLVLGVYLVSIVYALLF